MVTKIGLAGELRSGKDTVADYLRDVYDFRKFCFAEGVYTLSEMIYPEAFEGGKKPRAILQKVGAHLRKLDPNVWINVCLNQIKKSRNDRVVVTDIRYPNEAERLTAEGYTLIRVNCPVQTRIERAQATGEVFKPEDLTHESETLVKSLTVHHDIDNDGTLAELYEKIDKVIDSIIRSGGVR